MSHSDEMPPSGMVPSFSEGLFGAPRSWFAFVLFMERSEYSKVV